MKNNEIETAWPKSIRANVILDTGDPNWIPSDTFWIPGILIQTELLVDKTTTPKEVQ